MNNPIEQVINPTEQVITLGVRSPEVLISAAVSCICNPDAKLVELSGEPPYTDYYNNDPTKVVLYVKEESIGDYSILYDVLASSCIRQDAEKLLSIGNWVCNNIHNSIGFTELVSITESLIKICYKMKGEN